MFALLCTDASQWARYNRGGTPTPTMARSKHPPSAPRAAWSSRVAPRLVGSTIPPRAKGGCLHQASGFVRAAPQGVALGEGGRPLWQPLPALVAPAPPAPCKQCLTFSTGSGSTRSCTYGPSLCSWLAAPPFWGGLREAAPLSLRFLTYNVQIVPSIFFFFLENEPS